MALKGYRNGDDEFTRAACDELREAERGFQVVFVSTVEQTAQRGVWAFVTEVWASTAEEQAFRVGRISMCYPSSQVGSWGAFWYQHCHKAARLAEDWHVRGRVGADGRALPTR